MRISCDSDDPGFAIYFPLIAEYRVLLNGIEQRETITADEDAGLIVRVARDEHGSLILNDARDDIVRELIRGKVEIVTAPRPSFTVAISSPLKDASRGNPTS